MTDRKSISDDHLLLKACDERLDIIKKILDYAYISESTPDKFYKKFREYINQSTTFNDLQFIADQKYHGIIGHLKATYPNLNQTDLNYCSMICLGFSSNAIRLIYQHSNSSSIYNRRSKIHTKLKAGHIHLDTFLHQTIRSLAKKSSNI